MTQDNTKRLVDYTAEERKERLKAAARLDALHTQTCFESGDHPEEVETPFSLGADAIRAVLFTPLPEPVETPAVDMTALMETLPVFAGENLHNDDGTWLGDGHEMLRKDQVMQVVTGTWVVREPESDEKEIEDESYRF